MTALTRRPRKQHVVPLITAEDFLFLLKLPALAAAALLAPERRWHGIAHAVERATRLFSTERLARTARGLSLWGGLPAADALQVLASQTEQSIGVLKDYLVGWSPQIELTGASHLDAARAQGRGAVLWIAHFCFNSLVGKMALARAGYDTWHVSRPEHGFTKSRFGMRVLNPIRIAVEKKYLAGRVVMDRAKPSAAMHEALQLLKRNGFVSITAGSWEGQLIATAALGDGALDLATGAPRLAHVSGAPLIPVFVCRDENTRIFSVTVEAPIVVEGEADRNAMIGKATADFLQRHAPYLAAQPYQWRDWEKFRPAR